MCRLRSASLTNAIRELFRGQTSHPGVPPHFEYTLTPLGLEPAERMAGLTDWIEEKVHALIAEHKATEQTPKTH